MKKRESLVCTTILSRVQSPFSRASQDPAKVRQIPSVKYANLTYGHTHRVNIAAGTKQNKLPRAFSVR